MIYAKIHTYNNGTEDRESIVSSLVAREGFAAFDVPTADWLSIDGGKIITFAELPKPSDKVVAAFSQKIQQHLDDIARSKGYDSILSACTYATSSVAKFKAEGQLCVDLRDQTWTTAYSILGDVKSGKRPMPTMEEVTAELPKLVWPNA